MKFFFITGEISGDLHGSYLIKTIKDKEPDVQIYGVGGEYMKKAGAELVQDISELAIMGFVEAFKKYKYLKIKAKEYIEFIIKNKIDKIVLIDYGGFNLRFLDLIKKQLPHIKVYYYIPPKLWVWGKKRIHKLKKADHIIVIFPWEVEFYKANNIDVIYYGNPFLEKYEINKKEKNNKILLLPGSREQELKKIMPIYIKLIKQNRDKNYILKVAREKDYKNYIYLEKENLNVEVEFQKNLKELAAKVNYAIAVSGTVVLELALLGIPGVVVYKTSMMNEIIVKLFIKLDYIALPNIALKEEIYPELLQRNCNVKTIVNKMNYIEKNYDNIKKKLKIMRESMKGENILSKYAEFLLK